MGISLNEVLPFLLQMVIFQEIQKMEMMASFGNFETLKNGGDGEFWEIRDARDFLGTLDFDKIESVPKPAFSIYSNTLNTLKVYFY